MTLFCFVPVVELRAVYKEYVYIALYSCFHTICSLVFAAGVLLYLWNAIPRKNIEHHLKKTYIYNNPLNIMAMHFGLTIYKLWSYNIYIYTSQHHPRRPEIRKSLDQGRAGCGAWKWKCWDRSRIAWNDIWGYIWYVYMVNTYIN